MLQLDGFSTRSAVPSLAADKSPPFGGMFYLQSEGRQSFSQLKLGNLRFPDFLAELENLPNTIAYEKRNIRNIHPAMHSHRQTASSWRCRKTLASNRSAQGIFKRPQTARTPFKVTNNRQLAIQN